VVKVALVKERHEDDVLNRFFPILVVEYLTLSIVPREDQLATVRPIVEVVAMNENAEVAILASPNCGVEDFAGASVHRIEGV
jgi:hypothetical protein